MVVSSPTGVVAVRRQRVCAPHAAYSTGVRTCEPESSREANGLVVLGRSVSASVARIASRWAPEGFTCSRATFGERDAGNENGAMSEAHPRPSEPSHSAGDVEVAVIGAGQAGLAIGHFLARQGTAVRDPRAAERVGAAWRDRWDSLVLFTPRRYDALPGLAVSGRSRRLSDPRRGGRLPRAVRRDLRASGRARQPRALARARRRRRLRARARRADASRPTRSSSPPGRSRLPHTSRRSPSELAPEVFQTHSAGYRRPADVPDGPRRSWSAAATPASRSPRSCRRRTRVHLAVGSRQTPLPQRLLGRDLFWWLTQARAARQDGRLAHRPAAARRDTLIGSSPRELRRATASSSGRAPSAPRAGRCASPTAASSRSTPSIWATGYRPDHSWIELPVFDDDGRAPPPPRRHRRSGPLLPRAVLAAHARLGAARLGQGRRRVHRRADRGIASRQPGDRRSRRRTSTRAERI